MLWVTSAYPWAGDPIGGSFFRTQAQALAGLGASLTVAVPTPAAPWPFRLARARWRLHSATPAVAHDDGVLVVRSRYPNVPGEPSWALPDRFIAAAIWRSRRYWDRATVIHGHYAVTGLAAWRVARRAGLPFFLTFHGDDMNTWPDEHPERAADLRAAVSDARAVFTVSGALAQRVRDVTGVDAIALPLGCDHAWIDRSTRPSVEARRQLGLPEDRLIVLYVGYLHRLKGVRELAAAVLGLGDPFVAVLIGDGPERGYALDTPDAAARLHYLGSRSHEDVIRHMSAADVLVLPSHGEGLPTVLVEAGSAGLPVIASSVGGIPELIGEDRGTLLRGLSSDAISMALTTFRDHREQAAQAAERLKTLVRADYDVNTNAQQLLAHYRAAGGPVGGAA